LKAWNYSSDAGKAKGKTSTLGVTHYVSLAGGLCSLATTITLTLRSFYSITIFSFLRSLSGCFAWHRSVIAL
jgi:hypothetical protein